jgi:hypothetical protein
MQLVNHLCLQTVNVQIASRSSVAASRASQMNQKSGTARKKLNFSVTPVQQTTGKWNRLSMLNPSNLWP